MTRVKAEKTGTMSGADGQVCMYVGHPTNCFTYRSIVTPSAATSSACKNPTLSRSLLLLQYKIISSCFIYSINNPIHSLFFILFIPSTSSSYHYNQHHNHHGVTFSFKLLRSLFLLIVYSSFIFPYYYFLRPFALPLTRFVRTVGHHQHVVKQFYHQ